MAEPKITLLDPPLTGGCQCGAVRFATGMQPVGAHFCHCRMCQRAAGNVFAALAPVKREHLKWTAAPPDTFASSSAATRGFCAKCGTPLYFAYNQSGWVALAIGAFDEPERVPPTIHYGIESRLSWLHANEDLPGEATSEQYDMKGMTVFQYGAGDRG